MRTELILLAAGQSRRFGGIKQLASIHGAPMICHCLLQYREQEKWIEGLADGYVALGANADLLIEQLPSDINKHIVKEWQYGMGHTLSESMTLLANNTTHVLIGLADQVLITQPMIKGMLAESIKYPHNIVAAKYANKLGAPTIFPKLFFNQLCQLKGDRGASSILQQHGQHVIGLEMQEAAFDIDSKDDLKSYYNQQ